VYLIKLKIFAKKILMESDILKKLRKFQYPAKELSFKKMCIAIYFKLTFHYIDRIKRINFTSRFNCIVFLKGS